MTIDLQGYGQIQFPEHSAVWLMCVNLDQIKALQPGEGCMAVFRSCNTTTTAYALRID